MCWLVGVIVLFLGPDDPGNILRRDTLAVQFPEGKQAVGQQTLAVLAEALAELSERLPAGEEPIRVVICGTAQEFRRHAGGFARPHVNGIASPNEGMIWVKAPYLLENPGDYPGVLRHELVHVLLARNTDTGRLPRWLNEGLAMMLAKEHRWNSAFRVGLMCIQGRLIPLRDLDLRLEEPGVELKFGDAYSQSLLLTRFLLEQLDEDKLWDVVYSVQTMSFGDALRLHAGMSPPELYEAWVRSLWKFALIASLLSGFGLFQLMALLTIVGYLRMRRRAQRILRQWEAEEEEWEDEPAPQDQGDASP